jgi:putative salt-induced outer membrane protein YdiY
MLNRKNTPATHAVAGALLAFITLLQPVMADTLLLKDGSRLHGEVVRQQEGVLEFSTAYAGVIQVQWDQVSELQTDRPVEVLLDGGKLLQTRRITKSGTGTVIEPESGGTALEIGAAQRVYINPDRWQRGEGYKLTGRVNLGLDFQEGNTDKQELGLDGEVKVRRQHDRLNITAQFEKDKSVGVTIAENWQLRSKYDYFVADKWYFGGSLYFEHDRFADLDLRTSVGPHVGYQFFESKALNLSADASLLVVTDDFTMATDDDYSALGWTIDFDKLLFTERVQLYHRQTGQFEIGDTGNVVVNSWTGLRFPLYEGINGSTEAQIDYDGGAPSTIDKVDTIYRIKLGYAW